MLTKTLNSQPKFDEKYSREAAIYAFEMSGDGLSNTLPRAISHERISMNSNPGMTNSSRGYSPTNRMGKSTTSSVTSSKYSVMADPNLLDVSTFLLSFWVKLYLRVSFRIQEEQPLVDQQLDKNLRFQRICLDLGIMSRIRA